MLINGTIIITMLLSDAILFDASASKLKSVNEITIRNMA